MTQLIMEFFKLKSGTDIVHVPYRGAGPALNDVLAGHAAMMVINPGPTEAHVKAGRLRALAVTGVKRNDLLPEVPTFAELGYPMPEIDYGTTFGMLAPPERRPRRLPRCTKRSRRRSPTRSCGSASNQWASRPRSPRRSNTQTSCAIRSKNGDR